MSENKCVKGFKVFNPDWTCKGKHYTCPGKFEEKFKRNDIALRSGGIQFYQKLVECFRYYNFDPQNKVAEVIAYDTILEDGFKCYTEKLEIVREIPWNEVLALVNARKYCTGCGNTGIANSGSYCTGTHNFGNFNAGCYNSGDYNTGDYNKCNHSTGCFNTIEQKIFLFNKISSWTHDDWIKSEARQKLFSCPLDETKYINIKDMTNEEKKEHPEAKMTGGYLKKIDNLNARIKWWKNLLPDEKTIIKSIPNFDKDIFKEITGINVE